MRECKRLFKVLKLKALLNNQMTDFSTLSDTNNCVQIKETDINSPYSLFNFTFGNLAVHQYITPTCQPHYVLPIEKEIDIDWGVANGPSEIIGLTKFMLNFTGLIVFSS